MRRRRCKQSLSPGAIQALIWAGAALVCVIIGVAVVALIGRSRPVIAKPPVVSVSPEVAAPDQPADPAAPVSPEGPAATPGAQHSSTPARPRKLTEDLFVELSALMMLAAESFTNSEVGQKSLEQACEGILQEHGVSRADFEKMSNEIANHPKRTADIRDRVFERVDALRQPDGIHMEGRPTPSVNPRRPSPNSPTPQR